MPDPVVPTMMTGVQAASFTNLQLNAGVLLLHFDESASGITSAQTLRTAVATAIATPANYFGATKGGGSFTATPTTRDIELDGMRWPIIGSTVIDMWDIRLAATLAEVGHTNFVKALAAATSSPSGNVTTIQLKNTLASGDYISSVSWVGDLSDGRVCLIKLLNAVNIDGITLTWTDKGEGTYGVNFRAHASALTGDYAPCKIMFFAKST